MKVDSSLFCCSTSLFIGIITSASVEASSSLSSSQYLRTTRYGSNKRNDRSLQDDEVIRTDLVRLIPFDVQIAIKDDSSSTDENGNSVSETLYQGGSLLTDPITDWMMESFETKTTNQNNKQLVNNSTSFDSIALELIDQRNSQGTIGGQELNLVQVSFAGVSLWERVGTGTPPMEPEIVELIQRATFLEDKKLKEDLQTTINNLLIDLGIDEQGQEEPTISIVDVRAYITPPITGGNTDVNDNNNNGNSNGGQQPSNDDNDGNNGGTSNQNLEIIIIVAIVVACLAFALLIFAVIWAWRSDRRDLDEKPSSSSQGATAAAGSSTKNQQRNKSKRSSSHKSSTSNNNDNNSNNIKGKSRRSSATHKRDNSKKNDGAVGTTTSTEGADFPDILNNGSYPKEIGNLENGTGTNQYPDSVISEDISTSLTAYYKSGMAYNNNSTVGGGGASREINDAASMSSMDSYGYSLDGYAPSLGPAQGGYPVGPLQSAKDAPVPIGNSTDAMDIVQLQQEEESVADYDAQSPATTDATVAKAAQA